LSGIGTSYGAITVINAMPCGIGATIGTTLMTSAKFAPGGDRKNVIIRNDPGERTEMAEICVSEAYSRVGKEEPDGWTLDISSDIPISRGLKSSSSACNAIISAVFNEHGYRTDEVDLVRLGVKCARKAKVTVTGAFDDACGCFLGGFVITDNGKDEIILHRDVEDLDVVIHIPDRKIPKTGLPLAELRALAPEVEKLVELSRSDPYAAMTGNGRLISSVSGVDNSIAELAMKNGALGAGMSGSGPAIAIVLEKGDTENFLNRTGIRNVIKTNTRRAH
jgi:shikimate kinase